MVSYHSHLYFHIFSYILASNFLLVLCITVFHHSLWPLCYLFFVTCNLVLMYSNVTVFFPFLAGAFSVLNPFYAKVTQPFPVLLP